MANPLYGTSNFSTTLNVGGGINNSQTTGIILTSVSGLNTNGGMIGIDWASTIDTSTYEVIEYGGVSGNELTGVVRGQAGTSAKSHNNGATVVAVVSAVHNNRIADKLRSVDATLAQDPNNNEIVKTTYVASAVNELTVSNAATGNAPSISATGGDTNIDINLVPKGSGVLKVNGTTFASLLSTSSYAPQGLLLNGKISITVASNNITVAIKGMDGNDPSSSNKVYCRIGDTVRTISSALSVTKNAGTNWFNSGATGLATNEMDYFVYLGYNATDGVTIGFARIPYAKSYGDFSATSTNEKYCAISTITTAASTDYYENIGRFAATLSATASFNWSVPTFTATNLIQRPIYETRWTTYTPQFTGFSANPSVTYAAFRINGNSMHVILNLSATGTSNANTFTISVPMNNGNANATAVACGQAGDNGVPITGGSLGLLAGGGSTVNIYKDMSGAVWTTSGIKYLQQANWLYSL